MRVIQINTVYEYSSTGRTTAELHEYMSTKEIESYVFCCNKSLPEKKVFMIGNKCDYKIHSFLSHLLGLQGFFSIFSTKRLVQHLMKISPDVVHLRVLHSNFINLPLLLKYLAKNNIATVITLHDCWFFTGHCCHFMGSNCYKWKEKCGNCPEIKTWNSSWLLDNTRHLLEQKKRLFGNIKNLTVVGVSDWVKDFIPYSILKGARNIIRIYNWVDVNKFKPSNTGELRRYLHIEDRFVVLGIAQKWTSAKGLNDILIVARQNSDMQFVLVGNLDSNIQLPDNVISVGVLSDVKKIIEYYSMADAFFNPSIRETFGKVTVEALSCGTPVVVYNATASPELVEEGCGYVVNANDTTAVSLKLKEIKAYGKSYYSKACRDFVVNNFSKDIIIQQYIDLYERLQSSKE